MPDQPACDKPTAPDFIIIFCGTDCAQVRLYYPVITHIIAWGRMRFAIEWWCCQLACDKPPAPDFIHHILRDRLREGRALLCGTACHKPPALAFIIFCGTDCDGSRVLNYVGPNAVSLSQPACDKPPVIIFCGTDCDRVTHSCLGPMR